MSVTIAPSATAKEINRSCANKLLDKSLYTQNKMSSYELIVPGKNNWLFRSQTDFEKNFAFDDDVIKSLQKLSSLLQSKGTTLVIAYPPTRGIVAHKNIANKFLKKFEFDPIKATDNYRKLLKDLKNQNIHIVGVPNFDESDGFFRKKDQHWNAKGARKTAQNVANYIKELPVYDALIKKQYISTLKENYEFEGRFNDVTKAFCNLELSPEEDELFETVPIQASQSESDLFNDELHPEVTLIGTSNSKADSFNANFDGFLKEYLSTDISNRALPGAGIRDPFLMYLLSEEYLQHPPKLIIWEIPSYYTMDKSVAGMLNQISASTHGHCSTTNTLVSSETSLKAEGFTTILDIGENSKIKTAPNYLSLKFSDPFYKKFSINYIFDDEKESTKGFRFKRTQKYQKDGIFFALLPERNDNLKRVEIKVPDKLVGNIVTTKICAPRK